MQPSLIFIVVGVIIFLILLGFSLISLHEMRKKAFVIVLAASLMFATAWLSIWFVLPELSTQIAQIVCIIMFMTFVLLAIPFSKPKKLENDRSKTKQFDERETVFARDFLEPESKNYNEFYEDLHPELMKIDEKIRNMPFPGSPGGKFYDEIKTNQASASFDVIDEVRHLVEPQVPENTKQIERSPKDFTKIIKQFVKYLGALDVGITDTKDYHLYSHAGRKAQEWGTEINLKYKFAIAFTTEMNYFMVRKAPGAETMIESANQYNKIASIALTLVKYLQRLGYKSRAHIDGNYRVMCTAVAHDAGLGELSRMGLLVTPKTGPRVRIGVVTTDLPLVADEPITFGVQNFCEVCKICADKCPSGAIDRGDKREIRGASKWQSKQENCFQYWKIVGTDCGICLDSCPYSAPDNIYHNFMRIIIKRNPIARKIAVIMSKILY